MILTLKKFAPRNHIPIILLLTVALAVGIITVTQYGESWDEADIYRYSQYAIGAYPHILHPQDLQEFDTNLNLYGPGYYVAVNLIARGLVSAIPAWSLVNAWHMIYFVTFLAGALALYLLSARWLTTWGAFGVTLLFLSQPLLWGHAFINPKDIPFMSFFTATIVIGLKVVDDCAASPRVNALMVIAAMILGLTSAFRVLGPLAGLIVLGYALHRLGSKVLALAVAYLGIAALTAYLSWPYLWGAPISRYVQSIQTMAQFPFASSLLFADQLYKANQLPRGYFPILLGIQLTEPALFLVVAGVAVSLVMLLRNRPAGPWVLFLTWFLIPATAIVGSGSPLYDNARQLYFLLPPLFMMAGIALERLFAVLTNPAARTAILLGAALPGILLAVRLHPYEYIYYNAFVGGTGGAYRHFEMDYWGVSFQEITNYLDSVAPSNASVLVYGPEQVVEHYARPDIRIHVPGDKVDLPYDYVIFLTRTNVDERRCKGAETIDSVGRRGAVFSMLKSIPGGVVCQ